MIILSGGGAPARCQAFSAKKKLILCKKSVDFLGDSAILFSVMRDMTKIGIEEVFEADPRARAEYDAVCDAWQDEAIAVQDAQGTVFIGGVAVWKILEKSA